MQPEKMSSLTESVTDLWDKWSIQGLIILSFSLQCFLILFAPLRKQIGGKWVWFLMISLWIAYLLADSVAVFTIGLIMHSQRSGMLPLWSSFLLLHLGGPDAITSFSIENNELWIRHLLGLLSPVGSSLYIILLSLSNDMLWLPTLLVLIAGIIKYAERHRAFFLANFEKIGNDWKEANKHLPPVPQQFSKLVEFYEPESIPKPGPSTDNSGNIVLTVELPVVETVGSVLRKQFKWLNSLNLGSLLCQGRHQKGKSSSEKTTKDREPMISLKAAVCLLGVLKSQLVGPPLSSFEKSLLPKDAHGHGMLRAIEIQLSLLYELLHTKLPVVDSRIGYVCRIVNLGCMLGALASFSLLKKHNHQLLKFDIWLTYGLLIGALALDLISIMFLISSDWITIAHFSSKWKSDKFINKRRWSNSVPQLSIFTICHHLDKEGDLAKEDSFDFLGLRNLFRKIRRTRWVKFQEFAKDQEWQFIFTKLHEKKLHEKKDKVSAGGILNKYGKQVFGTYIDALFNYASGTYSVVTSSLTDFQFMESLLIWHIATEYCYQQKGSASAPNNLNHQKICKLLSDYMFYLLVMEPNMIAVSTNSWKMAFEGECKDRITLDWLKKPDMTFSKENRISKVKKTACELGKALEEKDNRWEIMAEVWVEILSYAAVSCQPIVHARQVSKGGQLLTLAWLLMNYMELSSLSWFTSLPKTNG